MSSLRSTAEQFFRDCETGKGWNACQQCCEFEGDKIRHVTKIWNDVPTFRHVGGM